MAVKALRESLGMTQQRFAQETGAAINSIARYETGRRPKALMLRKLEELAANNQEFDLAAVFGQALQQEIGIRVFDSTSPYLPQTQNEAQAIVVLLEMMRNPKYEKQSPPPAANQR
jgi:transcriptional regulator with XRE-family HTH domain